jgi:glycine dehydrogenase subunit 1
MLEEIGVSSVNDFFTNIPEETRQKKLLDLPLQKGEIEVSRYFEKLAAKNTSAKQTAFFLGAGSYYHHIPATVDSIIQRSEFLTSYTPYQPEVSQGTLMAIFEFQSYITAITGQDIANASMYDGATALAEAVLMARRVTRKPNVVIHNRLHPHYKETLETYISEKDGEITNRISSDTACVIVQIPDFEGNIQSIEQLRRQCDEHRALLIVVTTEILSFGLLPAPTDADVVVGEAKSLGNPLSFGGPYLGIFACKKKYLRQMPGRVCGETVDLEGKRGYVLTLNTREQHIRREKATSNICTNEGLCALAFTVHASLLGESGFKQLAKINHAYAITLANKLKSAGIEVLNNTFFNEFTVQLKSDSKKVVDDLLDDGIIAGYPLADNKLLVAVTEMTTEEDMDKLVYSLR